ncbi:hypothetical protein DZA65_01819 [Dickeya dianthicola]|nr:hypothetical protein DZA65_01819 [Dickeya dianthicola]
MHNSWQNAASLRWLMMLLIMGKAEDYRVTLKTRQTVYRIFVVLLAISVACHRLMQRAAFNYALRCSTRERVVLQLELFGI